MVQSTSVVDAHVPHTQNGFLKSTPAVWTPELTWKDIGPPLPSAMSACRPASYFRPVQKTKFLKRQFSKTQCISSFKTSPFPKGQKQHDIMLSAKKGTPTVHVLAID